MEECYKAKHRKVECLQMETEDRIKKEEDLNVNIAKVTEEHIAIVEYSTQIISLLKEE